MFVLKMLARKVRLSCAKPIGESREVVEQNSQEKILVVDRDSSRRTGGTRPVQRFSARPCDIGRDASETRRL
jgi:hypothetical protein